MMKKIATCVLLSFVVASMGYAIVREGWNPSGSGEVAVRAIPEVVCRRDDPAPVRRGEMNVATGGLENMRVETSPPVPGVSLPAGASDLSNGENDPSGDGAAWENSIARQDVGEVVKAAPAEENARVVVYYFHGNARCYTCRAMEEMTREAVENGFPGEMSSGKVEISPVNVDDPVNAHFIRDYSLVSKSVVLVRFVDGMQDDWRNLERIWELARDREAFISYIQAETASFLGERK